MTRILVTGSRVWAYGPNEFRHLVEIEEAMQEYLGSRGEWDFEYGMPTGLTEILVGDCPTGTDLVVKEWATVNWVVFREFKADWVKFGSAAGPIRNNQMIAEKPDVCLAFPLVLDSWTGTMQCMSAADAAGIPVVARGAEWTRADYKGEVPRHYLPLFREFRDAG